MMDRLVILWHYLVATGAFTRWRDRQTLEASQARHMDLHLKRIARRSPYFRRLSEQHGLANWRQWPVMNKAELMGHFNEWNTAGIRLDDAWQLAVEAERTRDFSKTLNGITVGLSSGTSGSRGLFLASAAERRLWAGTLLARVLKGTLMHEHRAALFLRADSPLYRTVGSRRFQFEFFDLMQPLEDQWPRLLALRPTVLAAPPSVLVRLATLPGAAEVGQSCLLLSVADVLDETDRAQIEDGFQNDPFQIYQATEGFLAATCPYGRLHWNEDALIIEKEWLDAEHTRYAPIITDFQRFTQPIVRYRLDDVIVDDDGSPCRCGSIFQTLGSIEGRCDDVLVLPRAEGTGTITIFPDFVRRAMILAIPAGMDFTVVQSSLTEWGVALSQACPVERLQHEVNDLCHRLGAQAPVLTAVPWRSAPVHVKRRRVRCELPRPIVS